MSSPVLWRSLATLIGIFSFDCTLDWNQHGGPTDDGGTPPVTLADGGEDGAAGDDASRPACDAAADCQDPQAFECLEGQCVEYPCHAQKACPGVETCEQHACVPFVPPKRLPMNFFQTNGGGVATSPTHRLRWSAGVPQPAGVASNARYRITLGAGAER